MSARRWTRWVIPLVLLAAVVALNVAGFTVQAAQDASGRIAGLTIIRPPGDVAAVTVWNDTVYAGGQQGLFVIDAEQGRADLETFGDQLEPAHVRALLGDGETLWIGQDTGLVRVDDSGVHRMGTTEGLPSERIRCLMRDDDGRVWVGTAAGAAVIDDGEVTRVLGEADGLADDVVNSLAQDAGGRIWFGSYESPDGGVSVLAEGVGDAADAIERFTVDEGLPHPSVTCILPEADGTVWVGTGFHDRGGLARFSAPEDGPVSIERTFEQADGLAGPKVRSLFRSATGALWVGSERDGIAVWPVPDDAARAMLVTTRTGLCDNEVKCLLELPGSRLLLGTRNGITVLGDIAQFERDAAGGGN